ncbi:hypothetical protein [Spirillospora sp. NPDC029432]|uniref:hypothetical protein n=1 Tax=Spirillospora sp. NPDC029432 TaxID=3154599 RepID=UPI003453E113
MKARLTACTVGGALIAFGLWGILTSTDSAPADWALWLGGAAIVHDAVLVPVVLLAGALTTRLPATWKHRVQAALLIAGTVTLVALPMVLGLGERPDNPSLLPLPYTRNLLLVIAVTAALAFVARRPRRPRKSTGE